MNAKNSVVLDKSLVAEARRSAGRRGSADAVNAALREYVHLKITVRQWRKAMRKGRKYSTWGDLAELARIMREGGWDPEPYLRGRGKLRSRRSRA